MDFNPVPACGRVGLWWGEAPEQPGTLRNGEMFREGTTVGCTDALAEPWFAV
jgi:hypothetical protein